ncbi:MAG: hypothetical protein H6605_02930 [Flavobacteriales bacterium]|nr:hypothetical protein [Flavobacteriales bacterium]
MNKFSYGEITEKQSLVFEATAKDTPEVKQLYLVVKLNGTEYVGVILQDDGRELLLETENLGKIYISKSEIKKIEKITEAKKVINGEVDYKNPFTTRYVFTTNAFPIKKGESYATLNLYGPEVHFAITDKFNIGIMTTWFLSPLMIAMKYSIKTPNPKVNLSIGSLNGTSGYLNNFGGYSGLHFGNITFGDRNNNFTIGGGYGYLKTGSSDNGRDYFTPGLYYTDNLYYTVNYGPSPMSKGPLMSLSGMLKVGKKATFIFDALAGVFTSKSSELTWKELNPPTPYRYEVTATDVTTKTFAMVLMPSMRFQSKDTKAFQISIYGVTVNEMQGFEHPESYSFPIPMCTWYFSF